MARPGVLVKWRGDALLAELKDASDPALYAGGEVIRAEAQQRVPVRTGKLRDSGYVGVRGRSSYVKRRGYKRERKSPGTGVAVVGFAARHSHLVEKGTVNMQKRPFLRPGLHAAAEEAGRVIAAAMRRELAD